MNTSYPLLVINNVDLTSMITVPNYVMNQTDVAETWTDGNKKEHEYIIRTRTDGRFTIKPKTPEEFHLFNSTIQANKVASGDNSGAVLASVYVNNLDTVQSKYFRFSYDPSNILPLIGVKNYDGFEVTAKEV